MDSHSSKDTCLGSAVDQWASVRVEFQTYTTSYERQASHSPCKRLFILTLFLSEYVDHACQGAILFIHTSYPFPWSIFVFLISLIVLSLDLSVCQYRRIDCIFLSGKSGLNAESLVFDPPIIFLITSIMSMDAVRL